MHGEHAAGRVAWKALRGVILLDLLEGLVT